MTGFREMTGVVGPPGSLACHEGVWSDMESMSECVFVSSCFNAAVIEAVVVLYGI